MGCRCALPDLPALPWLHHVSPHYNKPPNGTKDPTPTLTMGHTPFAPFKIRNKLLKNPFPTKNLLARKRVKGKNELEWYRKSRGG